MICCGNCDAKEEIPHDRQSWYSLYFKWLIELDTGSLKYQCRQCGLSTEFHSKKVNAASA
ncbi:MAG: hypothetical protein HRT88_21335 [Lentisphaeraceae bacterium]|nr:hypothetical protein [Lentisphaeraceae bacterium]